MENTEQQRMEIYSDVAAIISEATGMPYDPALQECRVRVGDRRLLRHGVQGHPGCPFLSLQAEGVAHATGTAERDPTELVFAVQAIVAGSDGMRIDGEVAAQIDIALAKLGPDASAG